MVDTAPILGLAAAVAWVSLVTVEFYERIYRDRIEKNSGDLRALGDAQLNEMIEKLREGKHVTVTLDDINSLKNAEETLMQRRKITVGILFLSSIFSIAASWSPVGTAEIPVSSPGGIPQEPIVLSIPVMVIAYILLLAVFVSGFWFLWKMLWFDEQILRIKKSKTKFPWCPPEM